MPMRRCSGESTIKSPPNDQKAWPPKFCSDSCRTKFHQQKIAKNKSLFQHVDREFSPVMLVVVMCIGGLISGTLVFTFARSAVIAFLVMLLIFAFQNRRIRMMPFAIIVVIGVAVISIPFVPDLFWQRMATLLDFSLDRTLFRRISYNLIGLRLWSEHPLFGIGPGNFPFYYIDAEFRYYPGRVSFVPRQLHNSYLEVATEMGLLGITTFVMVMLSSLRRGVQVVVGTPGRIIDHIDRGSLKLDELRCLVLDEADEMLRMGFIDDVEKIIGQTPPERQVALFSATMPAPIRRIAQAHLREPVELSTMARTATAANIRQRAWLVGGLLKLDALTRLLETEDFDGMIIFARTKIARCGG